MLAKISDKNEKITILEEKVNFLTMQCTDMKKSLNAATEMCKSLEESNALLNDEITDMNRFKESNRGKQIANLEEQLARANLKNAILEEKLDDLSCYESDLDEIRSPDSTSSA